MPGMFSGAFEERAGPRTGVTLPVLCLLPHVFARPWRRDSQKYSIFTGG